MKHILNPSITHTVTKADKRRERSMRITEVFKSNSDEERREAVTKLMIQLENKKRKAVEVIKQPKELPA